MGLIVDASVVVKWFVQEDRSGVARELVGEALRAPDLILPEAFSALAKRVRKGILPAASLEDVFPAIRRNVGLVDLGSLIDAAERIARMSNHSIYDCVYVAAAVHFRFDACDGG